MSIQQSDRTDADTARPARRHTRGMSELGGGVGRVGSERVDLLEAPQLAAHELEGV
jgi:hypothetical protein